MTDYVIDTCILVEANNNDMKRAFHFMKLLIEIFENHDLCLDNKREILREYERNGIYKEFTGVWFKNMQRAAKIVYVRKKIERKQKRELTRLKFDAHDFKFVATANACGKQIISDDSDYNEMIIQYLWKEMEIKVLHSDEKLE